MPSGGPKIYNVHLAMYIHVYLHCTLTYGVFACIFIFCCHLRLLDAIVSFIR